VESAAPRPLSPNARLASLIQPIISILATSFFLLAGWKELIESPEVVLQRIAIALAVFLFVLRLTISHFKLPKRQAHASATVAVLAAVSYPIVAILLSNTAWPTNYVAMALVLIGCIYTSRVWFYFTSILVAIGWTWASLPLLQGEGGKEIATAIIVSLFCSITFLEIHLRKSDKFDKIEKKLAASADASAPRTTDLGISKPAPTKPDNQPWCPVCKASRDAIVRHNGDFIVDANSSATSLLGMSANELAGLPIVGIFSDDRRDTLAPIFRFGNFEPLETVASGFKEEAIPVEILNGGLTMGQDGLKALLIRDLRKQEEAKRNALAISRRAQQSACRIRDLSDLVNQTTHESLEAYIRSLTKMVHRWLPCTIGCFAVLWDNQAQSFSVLASSAALPLEPKEGALGEGLDRLVGWLAEKMETLVAHRIAEDEFGVRKLYPHEPINAFCAIPLKNAGGMIGFMLVLERSHREFSTEDIDYLTLVTHCAASACNEELLHAQLDQSQSYEGQSNGQSSNA
jgi:hypothetical protein